MAIPLPSAPVRPERTPPFILSLSKDPNHCEERRNVAIPLPSAPVHPEPVEGPQSLRGASATWAVSPLGPTNAPRGGVLTC